MKLLRYHQKKQSFARVNGDRCSPLKQFTEIICMGALWYWLLLIQIYAKYIKITKFNPLTLISNL